MVYQKFNESNYGKCPEPGILVIKKIICYKKVNIFGQIGYIKLCDLNSLN